MAGVWRLHFLSIRKISLHFFHHVETSIHETPACGPIPLHQVHSLSDDMAKARKKKRTNVSDHDDSGKASRGNRRPKSMVIRMGAGEIGTSVTQLARDFRAVMEPDTASRLKVRDSLIELYGLELTSPI